MDGKLDWIGAGLPTLGTNAQQPSARDVARKDVPTCALGDQLGEVRTRVRAAGWDAVVVVNEEGVVLGLLRSKELDQDPGQLVEQVMRPGPSTFRPFVPIKEMAHAMAEHHLENCPITTSDGRLVGLLLQEDVLSSLGEHE